MDAGHVHGSLSTAAVALVVGLGVHLDAPPCPAQAGAWAVQEPCHREGIEESHQDGDLNFTDTHPHPPQLAWSETRHMGAMSGPILA